MTDVTIHRYEATCKIEGTIPVQSILDKTSTVNRGLADFQKKNRGWPTSDLEIEILTQLWEMAQNKRKNLVIQDRPMTEAEAKNRLSHKAQSFLVSVLMASPSELNRAINLCIDDNFSTYDAITNTFPNGILPEVEATLRDASIKYQIVDHRVKPKPVFKWAMKKHIQFRAPQEALEKLYKKYEHFSFEWCVGTGKTLGFVQALVARRVPTLFVVPSISLMHQTAQRISEYTDIPADDVGLCGDGLFKLRPVTIAVADTFEIKNKEFVAYGFQQILVDEAHFAGAKGLYSSILKIPAYYRHFASGTFFRTDHKKRVPGQLDLEGENCLLKSLGLEIKDYRGYKDGVELGYLAPVVVDCVDPGPEIEHCGYKIARQTGIINNRDRNLNFALAVKKEIEAGHTVLCLVVEKEHARVFSELLTKLELNHEVITSDTVTEERGNILSRLAKRELNILVGTPCLRYGIDVPTLDVIANVGGLKSKKATIQTSGRGVRKADLVDSDGVIEYSKTVAKILDCDDKHHTSLHQHAMERMQTYHQEGYSIPHLAELMEEAELLAEGRKIMRRAQAQKRRLSRAKSLPELKKERDRLLIAVMDPDSFEGEGHSLIQLKKQLERIEKEIKSLERALSNEDKKLGVAQEDLDFDEEEPDE